MKTIHKEEIYIKHNILTDKLFNERAIFFDIETTGFSPTTASVYMIGCARKRGKSICIDQFFAENPEEEKSVIQAFVDVLKLYNTIISFNGVGFDIPFLKAKCEKYKIAENFAGYNFIDIFKEISTIKSVLNLENYKQKTIERFLEIDRQDKYTGGDLISVYYSYVKTPSDELFDDLMLHNYEDVVGMIELTGIMAYVELVRGKYSVIESEIKPYTSFDGTSGHEMFITLKNTYAVPKRLSFRLKDYYINMDNESTKIRIPVINDTLKYFYPDYKDYYYLPDEDIAIHKSVAEFVDKDHREKCHAYNCYNRKNGNFIPQHSKVFTPEFKADFKDKVSYFEITDEFCESEVMLRRYIESIFSLI